ncbi:conserved protein, permease-related protein [Maledivibacter halophilus]|uniref:Permease n=1 Tax=Maledivibacter halophilus TaxID=36842 RepID=A0A1T5MII6_9FIRM|nr:conserved protein, permease-related protein [Maledivibacter halophilus]SKC88047.1 hypothetical protein SAMN02194393_04809 [Maledivibacter halophilus]
MIYIYILTAMLLILSSLSNKQKTIKALKIAWKKFIKIMPSFGKMLILVSIVLYLLPDEIILKYLGNKNIFLGTILAAVLGSITMMPGFIAFPLCGILIEKGISHMTIASFSTSLMMVGILTYPVESEYFGKKLAIIRNTVSFFIVLIIAAIIGLFYGEVIL